jgi:hypothetical protein
MNNYKKKYIKINITDIAGCINKNTYISRDVMILKIWERYDYSCFINAIERNKLKIVKLSEINRDIEDKILNNYLIKYNESKINMKNGLHDKPIIIEKIQKLYNIKIENDKNKYTLFINKPKYFPDKIIIHDIIINGFISNFVENENKYIIDIKSRQKEMINFIQSHEEVNIITCMKMSNVKKCQHFENFNGEIRTEFVYYDETKWKKIEIELLDFINYFEKIYYSIIFQDLFLKKKIINNSESLEMLANNLGYVIIKDTRE